MCLGCKKLVNRQNNNFNQFGKKIIKKVQMCLCVQTKLLWFSLQLGKLKLINFGN